MKHFLRPYQSFGFGLFMGLVAVPGVVAQSGHVVELVEETNPLLHVSSSQGYLGVWVDDVDNEKAQTLKLKEVRGALITLIDHDAPAGQIGLRVNDVVLQLNGQNVEGAEQLRRMLKEIPPGRKVSLEFSRDGNVQTTSVELVDHRAMEHDVWNKLGKDGDAFASAPGMGVLPGAGDASLPGMFHMPIFGSTLNVGAMVEPLTGQMAEYLGIPNGLMVKTVAHKSEAAAAGLKAHDVILKVAGDAVTTLSDWDRALRSNQGKPVQVTILRDRRQQTLTLQVDSKHKTGELKLNDLFHSDDCPLLAELDAQNVQLFSQQHQAAAEALRDQAESLKGQVQSLLRSEVGQQQADALRKQAEQLRDQIQAQDFKLDPKTFRVDPKEMENLKQQIEQFSNGFKAEGLDLQDFKVDPKQLDDLKKQMDEFRKSFDADNLQRGPY